MMSEIDLPCYGTIFLWQLNIDNHGTLIESFVLLLSHPLPMSVSVAYYRNMSMNHQMLWCKDIAEIL